MKNLFSIGEISKIKDITIKTLRYYHKVGILVPRYIDDETGYRYYSIDQFVYIDIIKGCRALGTSIVELQDIFKTCDTDELLKFLEVRKSEAEENITKMKEIIKNIDTLKMNVEYSKSILSNTDIYIKSFEQRYIIVAPCKESGSLKELVYYSNLDKVINDKRDKMAMEKGIIYDVTLDWNLEPKYVFNTFKDDVDIKVEDNVKILPKGRYLTLVYSKENEEERIDKIINYVKENNLKINNFIEIELFNDIFNTESYSCQIQMLIEHL